MSEGTDVFGHRYKFGRMSAMTQFHVMRRLYAVSASLGEGFDKLQRAGGAAALEKQLRDDGGARTVDLLEVMRPLLTAVGQMRDEDVEFVVNSCLRVTEREMDGGKGWSAVMPQDGVIMFMDIEMPQMLALTWNVLRTNLSGFFFDLLSGLTDQEMKQPGSSS